jgi:peptidyl-prolyl cis-trans isomerase C
MQMKIRIAVLLIAGLAMIDLAGCSGKKDDRSSVAFPDSIVDSEVIAKVNNYTIRGNELRTFAVMNGMVQQENLSEREQNERLLDEFIRRVLLWQEAGALGILVDDSTTQAVFNDFQRSVGGEEIFAQRLDNAGITRGDLLQSIHRDLVIREFLDARFSEEAVVDESEALAFYEQNTERFTSPDSVRARHILLEIHEDDNDVIREDKRKRIEEILSEAKSGGDFALLAQQHSEGPSSVRGGDLGFFGRGEMVPPFDSAAFALDVGAISGVVKTRFGYHIIKVEERRDGRILAFDGIKDNLLAQMKRQRLAAAVQNHLNEMMNVAIIERNYTP